MTRQVWRDMTAEIASDPSKTKCMDSYISFETFSYSLQFCRPLRSHDHQTGRLTCDKSVFTRGRTIQQKVRMKLARIYEHLTVMV